MSDFINIESAGEKMSESGVGAVEAEGRESVIDASGDFGNSEVGDGDSSGATSTTVVEEDDGSGAEESGSLEDSEEEQDGSESSDAEETGSESTSSATGGPETPESSSGENESEEDAEDGGGLEEVDAAKADWVYVDERLLESESLERAFKLEEKKAYVTKFTSRRFLKKVVKKSKKKPEIVLMTEWTCSYCRKYKFENERIKSHKLNTHLKSCEAYKNRAQRRAQGSRQGRHVVFVPRPEEGVPAFDVTGHRGLINTLIDRTKEHERRLEKLEDSPQSRKNEIRKIVEQCLPGILKDLKQVKITGSIHFTPAGSSISAVDPEQPIIPTPPPRQDRAEELQRPPVRAFNPETFTARELEMIGVRPGSKRVKSKKNTSKKD